MAIAALVHSELWQFNFDLLCIVNPVDYGLNVAVLASWRYSCNLSETAVSHRNLVGKLSVFDAADCCGIPARSMESEVVGSSDA